MNINIKWLGTAGFDIKTDQTHFLIDPYLTRNDNASPKQSLCPDDMENIDMIFVSHGHFDHTYDIQSIATKTGAKVFCCETTKEWLVKKGVDEDQIHTLPNLKMIESLIDKNPPNDGILYEYANNDILAQAFYSHHVE
ncbi:MAG: MBL fold metallo-hydrolase, partial [Desulfobacterales bacterium]|nr:MBL fold metallo-hydrolase [Desulfobacterales bacterium]